MLGYYDAIGLNNMMPILTQEINGKVHSHEMNLDSAIDYMNKVRCFIYFANDLLA